MSRGLIDKAIRKLIQLSNRFGVEKITVNGQAINASFPVTPRPYGRVGIIIPNFSNINSWTYNVWTIYVDANATTAKIGIMPKNDGTFKQDSTKIDVMILFFPVFRGGVVKYAYSLLRGWRDERTNQQGAVLCRNENADNVRHIPKCCHDNYRRYAWNILQFVLAQRSEDREEAYRLHGKAKSSCELPIAGHSDRFNSVFSVLPRIDRTILRAERRCRSDSILRRLEVVTPGRGCAA